MRRVPKPTTSLLQRILLASALLIALPTQAQPRADDLGFEEVIAARFAHAGGGGNYLSLRTTSIGWLSNSAFLAAIPQWGSQRARIERVDIETAARTFFANGSWPLASHDGRYVAYYRGDGRVTIARLRRHRPSMVGEISLTPVRQSRLNGLFEVALSHYVAWAPDSDRLVFVQFSPSNAAYGDRTPGSIWLFDAETGEQTQLAPRSGDDLAHQTLSWVRGVGYGPGGRVYVAVTEGDRRIDTDTSIYSIDPSGALELVEADVSNEMARPIASSTSLIAYDSSSDPDRQNYGQRAEYTVLDTNNGHLVRLPLTPLPWGRSAFSPDGRLFQYTCKRGAYLDALCSFEWRTGDIEVTPVETAGDIFAFAMSPDGQHLAWLSRTTNDVVNLRIRDLNDQHVRTFLSQPLVDLSRHALGRTQRVEWHSTDGLPLEGLLLLPVNYREGDRVPLIVDIHGGAAGGIRLEGSLLQTFLEHQVWANRGYAVFLPDYRKGLVSGQRWELLRRREGMTFDEADALDIETGIRSLIAAGIVDVDRIVGIGHSYGARVLNQLASQSDILAVGISYESNLGDLRSGVPALGSPGEWPAQAATYSFLYRSYGPDLPNLVSESSPITRAQHIHTPLLLINGGFDSDFAPTRRQQAEAFVHAINAGGGAAELLFFPEEGHVFNHDHNVRIMIERVEELVELYAPVTPPHSGLDP